MNVTGSIVLYNENEKELIQAVESFVKSRLTRKLYLIDNSPIQNHVFKNYHPKIEYIFNNQNLGFGKAHNLVLESLKNNSDLHLILNPDVFFDSDLIAILAQEFKDDALALISPKVLFPNEEMQYTARKYPILRELFGRYFGGFKSLKKSQCYDYQSNVCFSPDFFHGAFLLFRSEDFMKIGGFDERYFLYMEDVDICRKIDQIGKKKLYYPDVHIYHRLKKESSKKIHLFVRHLISVIKYFNKWGYKF